MLKLAVGTILGSTLLLAGAAQADIRVIYPPYAYQPRVSLFELSQIIYGPVCCGHGMMGHARHGAHHRQHAMMTPDQNPPEARAPVAYPLTTSVTEDDDILGP